MLFGGIPFPRWREEGGRYFARLYIPPNRLISWQNEYSVVQKNSSMFEFAAFLLPTNLGQLMHSPSALTEHVSLDLAWFFLVHAVYIL